MLVHGLYGRLSYHISIPPNLDAPNDLVILFGDNGCGKSTILKLVYRLLSAESSSGHRTFISHVPFYKLRVVFCNDLVVEAIRNDLDSRAYRIHIRSERGKEVFEFRYGDDAGRDVKVVGDLYCSYLKSLGIGVSMLGEDRLSAHGSVEQFGALRRHDVDGYELYLSASDDEEPSIVDRAMQGATRWAQSAVIESLNEGQVSTEKIYLDVVRRLLQAYPSGNSGPRELHDEFRNSLLQVKHRLEHASASGLMPSAIAMDTVQMAIDAPSVRVGPLQSILGPFVESLKARLDALSQIEQVIYTFTSTLSDYLVDKQVVFDRRKGFLILLDSYDKVLSPRALSSGEQQLLMLFSTVLSLRDRSGVIIVDEPEISLNPHWQRRLVDSLIKCAEGAPVQFIFATHSTAILSQHGLNAKEMRISQGEDLFLELSNGDKPLFNR